MKELLKVIGQQVGKKKNRNEKEEKKKNNKVRLMWEWRLRRDSSGWC